MAMKFEGTLINEGTLEVQAVICTLLPSEKFRINLCGKDEGTLEKFGIRNFTGEATVCRDAHKKGFITEFRIKYPMHGFGEPLVTLRFSRIKIRKDENECHVVGCWRDYQSQGDYDFDVKLERVD